MCNCLTASPGLHIQQNFRTAKDYLREKAAYTLPAVDSLRHFMRSYCCICCNYRRRKSIGVASATADDVGNAGNVGNGIMSEAIDGVSTTKHENNVTFDDWKQPLEEPQLLEYTEPMDIQQLICNGGEQQNQSTPVLTVPGIPNEEHINKTAPTDGDVAVTETISITGMNQQPKDVSTQATPISIKSATYSQKSTASANSAALENNSVGTPKLNRNTTTAKTSANTDTEDTTDNNSVVQMDALKDDCSDNEGNSPSPTRWRSDPDVLQLEDVQDMATAVATLSGSNSSLKKNGSLASLQSRSESIKTQLGDTPTVLSRTQSAKSLLIEEDIEDDSSFAVIREQTRERSACSKEDTPQRAYAAGCAHVAVEVDDHACQGDCIPSQPHTPARSRSPTIAEIKMLSRRNSMIKSMESLYERPPSKPELIFDNTSTESGSAASSQINTTIPIKPQHTPLKQKAKTSHFLKNHRRVSPVKQAMKTPPAELYPPTMQRFDKPRDAFLKTFDQLDSSNWEVIMVGLKSTVRLMRHHPEHLENQMHMVCIQLTRSVRNLRSQVARAACQAATELFTLKSKCLEQECDDLVCALLHRTADTNRFIRADATRALESMCDNLTPPKVLNILTTKGALHQNALVRTTAAKLLHRLVERVGSDKVYTMTRENRDKFFVTSANLLLEGSLETRNYAKSIFRLLSDHPNYNRLLIEVIPMRTYRNVEKTLKSIR